jgi:hypothetical protein
VIRTRRREVLQFNPYALGGNIAIRRRTSPCSGSPPKTTVPGSLQGHRDAADVGRQF